MLHDDWGGGASGPRPAPPEEWAESCHTVTRTHDRQPGGQNRTGAATASSGATTAAVTTTTTTTKNHLYSFRTAANIDKLLYLFILLSSQENYYLIYVPHPIRLL